MLRAEAPTLDNSGGCRTSHGSLVAALQRRPARLQCFQGRAEAREYSLSLTHAPQPAAAMARLLDALLHVSDTALHWTRRNSRQGRSTSSTGIQPAGFRK